MTERLKIESVNPPCDTCSLRRACAATQQSCVQFNQWAATGFIDYSASRLPADAKTLLKQSSRSDPDAWRDPGAEYVRSVLAQLAKTGSTSELAEFSGYSVKWLSRARGKRTPISQQMIDFFRGQQCSAFIREKLGDSFFNSSAA